MGWYNFDWTSLGFSGCAHSGLPCWQRMSEHRQDEKIFSGTCKPTVDSCLKEYKVEFNQGGVFTVQWFTVKLLTNVDHLVFN